MFPVPVEISSRVVSPTSPIHIRPLVGSTQNRQGLRKPHAKMRWSGAAVLQVGAVMPLHALHDVTIASPTSGLSVGIAPLSSTLRIFPFGRLRQLPYLLFGGVRL